LDCPTVVATEVLLLRPRGVPGSAVAAVENRRWPMFVMAVTEPTDPATRPALPLVELLDRPRTANEPSIVAVETAWSVLDPANALLTLTVRASVPVSFDLRILLPAASVLDALDTVGRGATIGLTTRDRAARLRGRVDVGTALRDVVLLTCSPSVELADLTAAVRAAQEDGRRAR
jgi:hypothetical protein